MFWSSSFRPPLLSWRRRNRQPTSSQPAIRRCSHEPTRTIILEEKTTHSLPCKSLRKSRYLEKRGESRGPRPLQANRQFPFILIEAFNVLLFLWRRLSAHVHVWRWLNRGTERVDQQVFLQLVWSRKTISYKRWSRPQPALLSRYVVFL